MADFPNYEFYVLNYDFNAKKIINFNIFSNHEVLKWVTQHVEDFNLCKLSFEELCEEIRKTIAWQEWGRRQYEISVGDAFETNCDKLEKWDCYKQALPNLELIAKMCIERYNTWKLNKLNS